MQASGLDPGTPFPGLGPQPTHPETPGMLPALHASAFSSTGVGVGQLGLTIIKIANICCVPDSTPNALHTVPLQSLHLPYKSY